MSSVDIDFENESIDSSIFSCAKALKKASGDGSEYDVFVNEDAAVAASKRNAIPPTNFFHDDQLFSCLSLGSLHTKERNHCSDLSDNEDDLEPFEKLARNMEDLTGDGGVLKKIVTPGVGARLAAGTAVRFHYSAFLEYGDEPMDSSYLRGRPVTSHLGHGDVLLGLEVALQSMRLKEVAQFIFAPRYAFGQAGCPPRIPGDA
ncbi:inactive peptidyl-prolyl cis-trans isomerase FKBP6, partial [Hyalella azteca]|uniref:peptidylprolyl isomerase n=1 Tax=Hyalella azteca TaxID=294128 RepID=A0A8B7NZX9_HYAAZ